MVQQFEIPITGTIVQKGTWGVEAGGFEDINQMYDWLASMSQKDPSRWTVKWIIPNRILSARVSTGNQVVFIKTMYGFLAINKPPHYQV